MIEEHFFYRKFNSSDFKKSKAGKNSSNPVYIIIRNNIIRKKFTCYCPQHSQWEYAAKIERHCVTCRCGYVIKGFPVVQKYFYNDEDFTEYNFNSKESVIWDSVIIDGNEYNYVKFIDSDRNNPKLYYKENEMKYDDNCHPFSFVGLRVFIDYQNYSLSLEKLYYDEDEINKKNFNFFNKIPLWRQSTQYSLKDGSVKFLDTSKLPLNLEKFLCKKYMELIYLWAGRKISFNTEYSGLSFLYAATGFPYEPNLSICFDKYENDNKVKMKIKELRENPDCFNKVCEIYKIKPYKTLRKAFTKFPSALKTYQRAVAAGFRDKNIINTILFSEEQKYFFEDSYNDIFNFFVSEALKRKKERSVWNLIKKSCKAEFFSDSLYMFMEYFRFIPAEVLAEIMKNGLTDYYHDVLAGISQRVRNENVVFEYSETQKQLEDEIDCYVFKLPENSDKLIDIGIKLHNCVASYKTKVVNGDCIIVYAEKKGVPEICIEIRENTIHQQRIDHNAEPKGETKAVMEKYQNRHKLKFLGNSY